MTDANAIFKPTSRLIDNWSWSWSTVIQLHHRCVSAWLYRRIIKSINEFLFLACSLYLTYSSFASSSRFCDRQVWTCGGELLISTCSHVGHVFRKHTPYTFPGGTSKVVNHNNARLAEVWLDEWTDFYFNVNPGPSFCRNTPIYTNYPMAACN